MRYIKYGLLFSVLLVVGCTQPEPTYKEQLKARPMPTTKQEKDKECLYIRTEIARMQSVAYQAASTPCNPQYGLCIGKLMMAKANRNIAELENRASTIKCSSAFSSTSAVSPHRGTIDECIAACLKNTKRTSAQCFDSCNK